MTHEDTYMIVTVGIVLISAWLVYLMVFRQPECAAMPVSSMVTILGGCSP